MTALLLCCLLAADPAPPALERPVERAGVVGRVRIEPAVVPLTDDIRLTLTVEAAAPLAVEPPSFARLPGWRLRRVAEPEVTSLPDGRQRWQQAVRLTPDRPGELPLPVPPVTVRPGGRETPVELTWEPIVVRVTTRLTRVDLDEARGVTGPEPAPPRPPSSLGAWLAAVGTVLGLVVTVAVAWRRRHRPQPVPEPPPDVWANTELDRLAALDPADPAAADALADLLRGFLARRYQFPATGKTTAELLALLHGVDLPPEQYATWRTLLERCDLARFARLAYAADEWPAALQSVRELVAASLPVGETAGAAQAGDSRGNA